MRRPICALVAVASILVAVLAVCPTVSAHELQQNNGISAVLHIFPDDNPRAVEDTYLDFDFSSQQSGFDLRYCGCKVSLQVSPDRLLTTSVISNNNSPTIGHAVVNFPAAGVYDVGVSGQTADRATDRFNLVYRVRVAARPGAAYTASSAQSWQVIMLSATSLVLLGVMASEMMRRGGRYTAKR